MCVYIYTCVCVCNLQVGEDVDGVDMRLYMRLNLYVCLYVRGCVGWLMWEGVCIVCLCHVAYTKTSGMLVSMRVSSMKKY